MHGLKGSLFSLIVRFIFCISFVFLLSAVGAAAPPPNALVDDLAQTTGGGVDLSVHPVTGAVRFLHLKAGYPVQDIQALQAIGKGKGAESEAAARGFFSRYGQLFGLTDESKELKSKRHKQADRGRSFTRFQQVYQNIPVFGGELVVQTDATNRVISVNGKTSPNPIVDTAPTVDASVAKEKAVELVSRLYNIEPSSLTTSTPELWIYNPVLLDHELDKNFLVWRLEVSSDRMSDIDELVLVDANNGFTSLHFNQIPNAKSRTIYDNQNLVSQMDVLPGLGPVRTEGQGAYGITDVDKAYDYMGFTYDFYWTYHGRDSINNSGMILKATVRHCSAQYACPMQNAFWNPQASQMVFGNGFTAALDIVGHELTHGVTQYESSLFYYMQSGAISESLSDVWGEIIQQVYEPPVPANRWLMGENLSGGDEPVASAFGQ
ncbi:MAG: M4 family metallopeptidase [Nitrospiraceae bacterium]|nr:M4 family metallopeptidase [Nitrospiraceae bacterium]